MAGSRASGKAAPFDLGWRDQHGAIWIAEVKSLARTSESQQLRLGLGQVLDYRQAIATPEISIRAALVIEQEPSDIRWVEVCAAVVGCDPAVMGPPSSHAGRGRW